MGEQMQMDGGRVGEKEATTGRGSAACRRAGSSWGRGTSAWSVGGKDLQRLRKKPVMGFSGMDFAEDFDHASDSFTASRNRFDLLPLKSFRSVLLSLSEVWFGGIVSRPMRSSFTSF